MFVGLFRARPKHTRLPQQDMESFDNEGLLPPSSSSTSLTLKPTPIDRSTRDVQVAVKTLAVCTVMYLSAALWIAFSIQETAFVANADQLCLRHVSLYCEYGWKHTQFT